MRHTNRRVMLSGPAVVERADGDRSAKEVGAIAGVRLLWLDAPELRRQALRLVTIAETERFRSEPLHADLFSSIRFDVGWHATASEGLPPGALEIEPPMRPLFKALRHWRVMRVLAASRRAPASSVLRAAYLPCRTAPHVCALATSLDLDRGAVAVGRALERIWLRDDLAYGLAFQPLAGAALLALEGYRDVDEGVRRRLASGWSRLCADALPLMVFRIGHARPPSSAELGGPQCPISSIVRLASRNGRWPRSRVARCRPEIGARSPAGKEPSNRSPTSCDRPRRNSRLLRTRRLAIPLGKF